MSFAKIIILYVASLVVFFAIDLVWLGLISKNFYNTQLGHLLSPKVNWAAALIFYLIFIAGILVFAVLPGVEGGSLGKTALMAAFFGLVCYATYDLSNAATVKGWPMIVTVVDMVWGVTISTIVGVAAYYIGRLLV